MPMFIHISYLDIKIIFVSNCLKLNKFLYREPELTPEERDIRTVFCMQLSARIRPRDLEEFFSSVGKVICYRIIRVYEMIFKVFYSLFASSSSKPPSVFSPMHSVCLDCVCQTCQPLPLLG